MSHVAQTSLSYDIRGCNGGINILLLRLFIIHDRAFVIFHTSHEWVKVDVIRDDIASHNNYDPSTGGTAK